MPRPYPAFPSSWGLTGVKYRLAEGEEVEESRTEREIEISERQENEPRERTEREEC